jgi:hypothetical protein
MREAAMNTNVALVLAAVSLAAGIVTGAAIATSAASPTAPAPGSVDRAAIVDLVPELDARVKDLELKVRYMGMVNYHAEDGVCIGCDPSTPGAHREGCGFQDFRSSWDYVVGAPITHKPGLILRYGPLGPVRDSGSDPIRPTRRQPPVHPIIVPRAQSAPAPAVATPAPQP